MTGSFVGPRAALPTNAVIDVATPVMVRELDRAVDTAVDRPQSLQVSDHFNDSDLRWMALLAETTAMAFDNVGTPWQPYLQHRRVARLLGPQAAPPPMTQTE